MASSNMLWVTNEGSSWWGIIFILAQSFKYFLLEFLLADFLHRFWNETRNSSSAWAQYRLPMRQSFFFLLFLKPKWKLKGGQLQISVAFEFNDFNGFLFILFPQLMLDFKPEISSKVVCGHKINGFEELYDSSIHHQKFQLNSRAHTW